MPKEGEIYLGVDSDEDLISTYAKEIDKKIEGQYSQRTIGGRLKTDSMYEKYTFTISYDFIDSETLAIIVEKYGLKANLNLRMYISNSDYFVNSLGNCPVVRLEPFSYTDFIKSRTKKIYKNASLVFLEV